MDYEALNSLFDTLQAVFDTIHNKYHLQHKYIDRWRWGQPQISLTWQGQDAIWRNIYAVVLPGEGRSLSGRIEVNAWQDTQEEKGWVRHWQHLLLQEQGPLEPPRLWEAYDIVVQWTLSKLTRRHALSAQAGELLAAQTT